MYYCGAPHMDEQRLDGQLEPIYYSSVLIQEGPAGSDERESKRGSGKSVLAARHDHDHDDKFDK